MRTTLIFLIVCALTLGACSPDDSGSTTPGDGGESTEETIGAADFAFSPASLTIAVGTTVTWENTDNSLPHTSTSDDEIWESGTLNVGDEFSFTFDEVGTFTYFCSIHPTMTGTIVVEG